MKKLQQCYERGIGVAQDEKVAAEWAKKAEVAEDLEKTVCKAKNLVQEPNSKSEKEAFAMFASAREKGSIHATACLGYCYVMGFGVEQKKQQGLTLLYEALKTGSTDALYGLYHCYADGVCVAQDQEKAVMLLRKAVEAENIAAIRELGRCYRDGVGCEKDIQEAVKLFTKAAAQGCFFAMSDLGLCYLHGDGVDQKDEKAVELFTQAADVGSAAGHAYLGFCYLYGRGVAVNALAAGECFLRGFESGSALATYYLGYCYLLGDGGLAVNFSKAVTCFTVATDCDGPSVYNAYAALSYCYRNGIGVAVNELNADEAWDSAIDGLGEEAAVAFLEWLANAYNRAQPKEVDLVKLKDLKDACSICLKGYVSGQEIAMLPCNHRFHKSCIKQWIGGAIEDDLAGNSTCPLCRHSVWTECVAE
jgi:TPR repeat protein